MRRAAILLRTSIFIALTACGPTTDRAGGGGGGGDEPDLAEPEPDMAMPAYQLPSGAYKVTAVQVLDDGCLVRPADAMVGVLGKTFALTNDGKGYIELGNYDAATNKAGARVGMPPQAAVGASCPGANSPPACATEPDQHPFVDNTGFLVRNNVQVLADGCSFRRRIVNEIVLDGDGKFSALYQRWESMHAGCPAQATACSSRWTWSLEFVKPLSM